MISLISNAALRFNIWLGTKVWAVGVVTIAADASLKFDVWFGGVSRATDASLIVDG
jgi:hypothetical protein